MNDDMDTDPRVCARCRSRPRMSLMTGCLCDDCEDAIEGMSQAELDADYVAHTDPTHKKKEDPP